MDWITIIQNAIDSIEENLCDKIEVEQLAKEQYVSSFYFQKMFSTLCECTVAEYIRNRRLSLALLEIQNTSKSILDIALISGYDSAEGFTKAFSRYYGITPGLARRENFNPTIFEPISLVNHLTGGKVIMGDLGARGYIVKETGAVYYTKDMDKTIEWFTNILGWYGQIDSRDENEQGLYGCVNNIPIEIEALHIAPFTGIHMFYGEPEKRTVGFMLVSGIEQLYSFVKSKGWTGISEIEAEPWGGKTVSVTTIDGCILTFFEL